MAHLLMDNFLNRNIQYYDIHGIMTSHVTIKRKDHQQQKTINKTTYQS